jgi:hypothetical protein
VVTLLLDPVAQPGEVQGALRTEGPRERFPALGEVQTSGIGMQMRPTSGCPAVGIGSYGPDRTVVDNHDAKQF